MLRSAQSVDLLIREKMDNLEYFIATLRALAHDYHIVSTSCRVSGTTIFLVIDTRQARPGAPSLGYMRERLQILDPNYRPSDLQGLLQPRAVPLPPPVGRTVARPVPVFPPGMFSVPPPMMPSAPPPRRPVAPLARPPISFLRADWNVPLPSYPVVPFLPPLGMPAPIPPLVVPPPPARDQPVINTASSTTIAPASTITEDVTRMDPTSAGHLAALARLAARVPSTTASVRTCAPEDLSRSPEIRAIVEKRPRPSVVTPSEAARASDHAPITHISHAPSPTGMLAKFSTITTISTPPSIPESSPTTLSVTKTLSSPPTTVYAALHAPAITLDQPVVPTSPPPTATFTCSYSIVTSSPEVDVDTPTSSWSMTYGGRARRYRPSRCTSRPRRLHRTPVIGRLPLDLAAAYEDRPTRAMSPVVGPVSPHPRPTTAGSSASPSPDTRDVFMGHPRDRMGE